MSIFVTSDLHLNDPHALSLRPQFQTLEEHDNFVIEHYNKVVGKDDLVYILGDVGYRPKDQLSTLCRQLNGRKILLIGNHDQLTKKDYINMGFIDVFDHPIYYNNNVIFSHEPVKEAFHNPWILNLHGHIHNGKLNIRNYFNVNIEMNGYRPLEITQFKNFIDNNCRHRRTEDYGKEWYAPWEQQDEKFRKEE